MLLFNHSWKLSYNSFYELDFLELRGVRDNGETLFIPGKYMLDGRELVLNLIYMYAQNCNNLDKVKSVVIGEGAELISDLAFYKHYQSDNPMCNVTSLTLPSSLMYISYGLFGDNGYSDIRDSNQVTDIWCYAVQPPIFTDLYYGASVAPFLPNCKMHVPARSVELYAQSKPWKGINLSEPIEGELTRFDIHYAYELTSLQDISSKTAMTLNTTRSSDYFHRHRQYYSDLDLDKCFYFSTLTIDTDAPLTLESFVQKQDGMNHLEYHSNYDSHSISTPVTSLLVKSPVTANYVEQVYSMTSRYENCYFITFPFDVRVGDIKSDAIMAWYSFDGGQWANSGTNYWRRLKDDDIIPTHQACLMGSIYCYWYPVVENVLVHVPAINNAKKNLIFNMDDVTVTIDEHPSKYAHRKNWNLVGNPYPCFYDMAYSNFTAPVTLPDMLLHGRAYQTYSPIDDHVILLPNQAFFVQSPRGGGSITFGTEGRQIDEAVREESNSQQAARRRAAGQRQVYTFTLSDSSYTDRARIVVNEQATTGYEVERDAAKMLAEADVPQLYVIDGGIQYAIDERPFGTGIYTLGMRLPADGTYHIGLSSGQTPTATDNVLLTDRLTGITVILGDEGYTFEAFAGTLNTRFTLQLRSTTGIAEIANGSSPDGQCFDLQGRAVAPSQCAKGVTILRQGGVTQKVIK